MILDCKCVKDTLYKKLKVETKNTKLKVVDILIGNDEASLLYIRNKKEMCEKLNIEFITKQFNLDSKEEEIINYINLLNNDKNITAIMLQLPIDKKYNQEIIINTISPNKDVDGLTLYNQNKLYNNEECIIPCTAKAIMNLLDYYKIDINNKNIVVVGKSILVGKPIAHLLSKNSNVIVCDSKTTNLKDITNKSDITILALYTGEEIVHPPEISIFTPSTITLFNVPSDLL